MPDVVACGELLIDFTPMPHPEPGKAAYEQNPGGAGDAFWGSLLSQLLDAAEPLAAMTDARLRDMVRFANAAGALTTTRTGAIPALPVLAEVERFLQQAK
ncbi:PfkB family carbohydrate kinase [Brevibacillus agri]|uniref:PfkB family carbohydrate kinase n=1 Tax=Brevibacillus agri TaxID=51101 RepID=UPI0025B6BFC0|nr:PfkB family carbohydrate kinase [Brevibacillus agri]MDN4094046.1 PfkB family carbohydrate kinase [Brevibacillus agri]MDR9504242.1 PfkB family carbohydrate kinase [Brevibacillus agri]MED1824274.1 PfkB family carbohydrate kinase [Brevibacillus agri]